MQALVVADIHGNWPALQSVLDDAPYWDRMIVAGDVVGINGFNATVVDRLRDEQFADIVFGNHDARIRPEFHFVPDWRYEEHEMRVVTEQLDSSQTEWIANLPERIVNDRYGHVVAHARPYFQRDPGYPVHGFAQGDAGVKPRSYTKVGPALDGKTGIIGHTHEQHAVVLDKFPGQSGLLLNPGAVGPVSRGRADYAVVDLSDQTYELRSVEYETDRVYEMMDDLGIPTRSLR